MSSTQSLLLITLIITIIVVVMAMLLINRRQLRDIEEPDNELGNMEDLAPGAGDWQAGPNGTGWGKPGYPQYLEEEFTRRRLSFFRKSSA